MSQTFDPRGHKLDIEWPEVSVEDQMTIQTLLSRLVKPVGLWRTQTARCSRGRRWKKIDRRRKARLGATHPTDRSDPDPQAGQSPRPAECSYLTLGVNSTTRALRSLAPESMPRTLQNVVQKKESRSDPLPSKPGSAPEGVVAVFVCRTRESAPLYAHLPTLVAAASDAQPEKPAIRLVSLSNPAESLLSKALQLPRVGVIGIIDNCPQAATLIDYVRHHVPPLGMSQ